MPMADNMLSKEKSEELECTVAVLSNGKDNANIMNQQEVDIGDRNYMDMVPKDTGWAWMCCLGIYVYCRSISAHYEEVLYTSPFLAHLT